MHRSLTVRTEGCMHGGQEVSHGAVQLQQGEERMVALGFPAPGLSRVPLSSTLLLTAGREGTGSTCLGSASPQKTELGNTGRCAGVVLGTGPTEWDREGEKQDRMCYSARHRCGPREETQGSRHCPARRGDIAHWPLPTLVWSCPGRVGSLVLLGLGKQQKTWGAPTDDGSWEMGWRGRGVGACESCGTCRPRGWGWGERCPDSSSPPLPSAHQAHAPAIRAAQFACCRSGCHHEKTAPVTLAHGMPHV